MAGSGSAVDGDDVPVVAVCDVVSAAEQAVSLEIRRRRRAAGLSQNDLALRVGHQRQYISRAEQPKRGLPSENLVLALDQALEANGELVVLWAIGATARECRRDAVEARPGKSQAVGTSRRRRPPPEARGTSITSSGSVLADSGERDSDRAAVADSVEVPAAARLAAASYAEGTVVDYFRGRLEECKQQDGAYGPGAVMPEVLALLALLRRHVIDVKASVRPVLLSVGADGAEFAGWLHRDLRDAAGATYWLDRAMEWAQEAGDSEMQGYVLLRKSQMAYEERDALRVLTLAQAARSGPWKLPVAVRAEIIQQEARGLAMTGEPYALVERTLGLAYDLVGAAPTQVDDHVALTD